MCKIHDLIGWEFFIIYDFAMQMKLIDFSHTILAMLFTIPTAQCVHFRAWDIHLYVPTMYVDIGIVYRHCLLDR